MLKEAPAKPPPSQAPPGRESVTHPRPEVFRASYRGSDKLRGKVAIVTGGDSGIGRAVAAHFAREGADVCVAYLSEADDAAETKRLVEAEGRRCVTFAGDVGDPATCQRLVDETVRAFGRLDVLVNHAAEPHPQERIEEISPEQLERTFRTNLFGMFHLVKAALPHLGPGSAIVNTTSAPAYRGSGHLLDYESSKGAIVAFTRSLAQALAEQGIRVNAVAPGPVWHPLLPSAFPPDHAAQLGKNTLLQRPGEPSEIAPAFVYLASEDASYMTGQVLHPNGGEIVNA
jgi:NAD(P)-dependent dehydrogenase (short-subunit alcohol dehydrogenase family)